MATLILVQWFFDIKGPAFSAPGHLPVVPRASAPWANAGHRPRPAPQQRIELQRPATAAAVCLSRSCWSHVDENHEHLWHFLGCKPVKQHYSKPQQFFEDDGKRRIRAFLAMNHPTQKIGASNTDVKPPGPLV